MHNIFSSIAKLLGRKSITNEEILEVLRNHEKRIVELEKEVVELTKSFDDQRHAFDGRLKDLAKKGQAAKKRSTEDLKQLRSDLDALIDALNLVVAGEFAADRRKEITNLIKVAKGHRTRVAKVIEHRVH
jgi:ABC-type transporter Mla subunit MlaD